MEIIKNLKIKARIRLKINYAKMLLVCFLMIVVMGSFGSSNVLDVAIESATLVSFQNELNADKKDSEIVNDFVHYYGGNRVIRLMNQHGIRIASEGFLGVLLNNVMKSDSGMYGALNSVNQLIFGDSIGAGIIIVIGMLLKFLCWVFISNIVDIGRYRFFLENHRYGKTGMRSVLLPFRVKCIWNQAKIMLLRSVFLVLWSFTVVGGIYKRYQYMMIPYILAENPKITRKEAFALSKEMMMGHKWEAFLLDFSFLGWLSFSLTALIILILSLTFSFLFLPAVILLLLAFVVDVIYLFPYMEAAASEYYFYLRDIKIKKADQTKELFCDEALLPDGNLDGEVLPDIYPLEKYPYPLFHYRMVNFQYDRKYSLFSYIWIFFTLSIAGYIWEVVLYLFSYGRFVNRGSLYGPWLPIYGSGGVLVILLLKRFMKKPQIFILLGTAICAALEYLVSFVSDKFFSIKYWDYTGYVLNIDGRVSLESVLVFTVACMLVGYIFAPWVDAHFLKMKKNIRQALCIVLVVLFCIDTVYSFFNPNPDGQYKPEKFKQQSTHVDTVGN